MKRLLPIVCLATLTLAGAVRAQPPAPPLVIQHATVIDATGAAPQRDVSILIVDGRIREIGVVSVPKGAKVIDATGKFVIPGLTDMHVHTVWPQMIDQFLPLFIANGVTTVRDMFGELELAARLKKEIGSGSRLAPRLISPGPIVDGPKPVWPGSIAVTTAEDGRAAVRSVKERGGDFVKVYSLLPRDAYFAIADEARQQKISFAGHIPRTVTAAEASDSGQRTIEHLSGVFLASSRDEDTLRKELAAASTAVSARFVEPRAASSYDPAKADALFARFVRNGTWQVPTLTVLRGGAFRADPEFANDPRLKYMTPQTRASWRGPAPTASPDPANVERMRALFDSYVTLVGAMHKGGVRVLAGSDTPNPYVFPGFSLHDELALLVRSGMSPLQALQAATRSAAEFLGTLDETGTVERGKRADLVVLDANPLEDISHTQRIHAVIVNGRMVSRQQLDDMLTTIEKANREPPSGNK